MDSTHVRNALPPDGAPHASAWRAPATDDMLETAQKPTLKEIANVSFPLGRAVPVTRGASLGEPHHGSRSCAHLISILSRRVYSYGRMRYPGGKIGLVSTPIATMPILATRTSQRQEGGMRSHSRHCRVFTLPQSVATVSSTRPAFARRNLWTVARFAAGVWGVRRTSVK
jgi:hypothetical protein